ncbi:MAG TPA: NusG domain II-containing protein [Bacillota bacterium]|nr:NusG domain II-containing protein [Bacillota bacterium]HUM56477.1 NusG domain II-containing protein [Bacillota bacterium]
MLKKADIILAAIILFAGITASLIIGSISPAKGEKAVIISEGRIFGIYSLYENRTVTVVSNGHVNKILIKGGEAGMISSNCPGKDCIHQGKISKTSESIVCLPNKLIVKIEGKDKNYDEISK